MNVLHPNPISTRQLTFLATERRYVGEISSTHGFGRVYPDACDEGLTLVSATTGREVVFVVERTERDGEGDVRAWHLVPVDSGVSDLTLVLFND